MRTLLVQGFLLSRLPLCCFPHTPLLPLPRFPKLSLLFSAARLAAGTPTRLSTHMVASGFYISADAAVIPHMGASWFSGVQRAVWVGRAIHTPPPPFPNPRSLSVAPMCVPSLPGLGRCCRAGGLQLTWMTARKLLLASRITAGDEGRRSRKQSHNVAPAHFSPQMTAQTGHAGSTPAPSALHPHTLHPGRQPTVRCVREKAL
jgi:hypothetical protein